MVRRGGGIHSVNFGTTAKLYREAIPREIESPIEQEKHKEVTSHADGQYDKDAKTSPNRTPCVFYVSQQITCPTHAR